MKKGMKFIMKYRCTVCGHEVELDEEMPDNFLCPVCGVGKEQFELIEE